MGYKLRQRSCINVAIIKEIDLTKNSIKRSDLKSLAYIFHGNNLTIKNILQLIPTLHDHNLIFVFHKLTINFATISNSQILTKTKLYSNNTYSCTVIYFLFCIKSLAQDEVNKFDSYRYEIVG